MPRHTKAEQAKNARQAAQGSRATGTARSAARGSNASSTRGKSVAARAKAPGQVKKRPVSPRLLLPTGSGLPRRTAAKAANRSVKAKSSRATTTNARRRTR